MSRKTIAFHMPPSAPGRSAPPTIEAIAEPAASEAEGGTRTDEWVRAPGADAPRAAPSWQSAAFDLRGPVSIDLAAERTLAEAVALSMLTPFALGWFWWVRAMSRRGRLWGL